MTRAAFSYSAFGHSGAKILCRLKSLLGLGFRLINKPKLKSCVDQETTNTAPRQIRGDKFPSDSGLRRLLCLVPPIPRALAALALQASPWGVLRLVVRAVVGHVGTFFQLVCTRREIQNHTSGSR